MGAALARCGGCAALSPVSGWRTLICLWVVAPVEPAPPGPQRGTSAPFASVQPHVPFGVHDAPYAQVDLELLFGRVDLEHIGTADDRLLPDAAQERRQALGV